MWAIGTGHALTHAYTASLYLLLPFMAKELGLTYSQIGLMLALRQLMSMVVNLPAGVIVDTVGRRTLFMGTALLGSTVPYLAIGASSSFWIIAVGVGLMGAANFLWHPAAITSISEMYPGRRGYGLALHELGANLGDSLMPLLTGFLLGFLSWRRVISITVAAGVPAGVVVLRAAAGARRLRVESDIRAPSPAGYLAGLRVLARNVNLMMLALVSGVRSFTQQGLQSFLPLYLVDGLKIPAALVGVYLTVVQVSGMIATPISGALSDRMGPKRVATAGMFSTGLVVAGFAAFNLGPAFVAALALVGFFMYSMRPAIFRWAIGAVPRQYEGTTVGTLFTTQALFSTLMPLIGGVLADRAGLISVFYLIAASLIVGNLAMLAVPDLRRQAAAEEATGR